MRETDFSIKQLVAYCLDYANLTASPTLMRPISTHLIPRELIDLDRIIFSNTNGYSFELRTAISQKEQSSLEEGEIEALRQVIARDAPIAEAIAKINRKFRVNGYTKQVVLETGFVDFRAKKIKRAFFANNTEEEEGDELEKFSRALIRIPIQLSVKPDQYSTRVNITLLDESISILVTPFRDCIPQQDFDEIFSYIAELEAEEKHYLPLKKQFIEQVWSRFFAILHRIGAEALAEVPNYTECRIMLVSKANYFLSEDLDAMTKLDEQALIDTAISSFVSSDQMDIEEAVDDKGETEIFFPFSYDKWQLKTLGIVKNKAVIVEGPPGTGKSQTIANLLVHLAATGNKVLFASQKDQAVRGVKDKLKELAIPFLFGYIPDRESRLHSENDERDSAANTLVSLDREFEKRALLPDQKVPLTLISDFKEKFNDHTAIERKIFAITNEMNALAKYKDFADCLITEEQYDEQVGYIKKLITVTQQTNQFEQDHQTYVEQKDIAYQDLEITLDAEIETIAAIIKKCEEILPERSGFINKAIINIKLAAMLKITAKDLAQEIYRDIEAVLFDDSLTKTQKLKQLRLLKDYFVYSNLVAQKDDLMSMGKDSFLKNRGILAALNKLIKAECKEQVFDYIAAYRQLQQELDGLQRSIDSNAQHGYGTVNDIRKVICDLRKFYREDTIGFVRNRVLANLDELKQSKETRSKLRQIARSLTKSKKAYRTFDKLKHDQHNFDVMSDVLPIWMMSLDDVSRIIPLQAGAFDYVVIDEASQCNLAYALPAMFRAKHVIFFGDSLQMRDTNTLFKSNEQLTAIAKKHAVPEQFQIKAEEDTIKSIMDIAGLAGFKTAVLKNHYRSPKELIGFSNQNFYEKVGRALDVVNDNILTYQDTNRVLLNHVIDVDPQLEDSAKTNHSEANYIRRLIQDIRNDKRLKNKSIAVLTFFNEQAELLAREIDDDSIKISTIEGIQGDERDIIIYSFVITDPTSGKRRYQALTGEGGEIKKSANEGRVNVAFSRARQQVHCVTCIPPISWPDGVWIKKYLAYVDAHGFVRRHEKSELQFDSKFEEDVYDYLMNKLSPEDYLIQTQVESCGFKIDQVITDIRSGKKLAIECDGPTHFEHGDGQVYVQSDWERQGVLETAGWSFYRISFFDWYNMRYNARQDLVRYITDYFMGDIDRQDMPIIHDLQQKCTLPADKRQDVYKTRIKQSHQYTNAEEVQQETVSSNTPDARNRHTFTVGDREVDQNRFDWYLSSRIGQTIKIRYQSTRSGSARSFRELRLYKYDATYLYAAKQGTDRPYRYRRDRVVEFRK